MDEFELVNLLCPLAGKGDSPFTIFTNVGFDIIFESSHSLWRNRMHQSIISHLQKRSLGCLGDIVLCIGDYTTHYPF